MTAGRTLSLFGARQLVVVRGLGGLSAKPVERLRAAIDAARSGTPGWPAEGTTVLFLAPGVDRRSPALRLVPDALGLEVRPPTGRAVTGWLRERARVAGLDLAPAAAEALVALVGEDLSRLATELEKAAVFAAGDRRLTEDVVRSLVGESRIRQYWELTQALEDGDRAKALRVLDQLLAAHEEPTVLLGQLVGYLRDLWRTKAGLADRKDAREIGKLLTRRRPDWAVERLMARASGVPGETLVAGVRRCFETEVRLKSSGGDPRTLLTVLVADLART